MHRAPFHRKAIGFCALIAAGFAIANTAHAAVIPGDLLIYRVGDGSTALGTTSAPVTIDEYTTAGAFVTSYALPSSGGSALTAVGNATTEGIMSRSIDGTKI